MRTSYYSYNLHYEEQDRSEIFRYDNSHEDNPHDGHNSPHHVHRFDPPGREILNSPFELDYDYVPTLGEVIEEVHEYWKATRKSKQRKGKKK